MELWIRSQDKKRLIKVNKVDIDSYSCRIVVNGESTIGIYNTKERCFEILDEIQSIIHPKLICTGDYPSDITKQLMEDSVQGIFYDDTKMKFEQLETYIYNMPKE